MEILYMNLTKHALSIGLIALSFNALAAGKSTVDVATASVDTSFIIRDECSISITAQAPQEAYESSRYYHYTFMWW